MQKLPPTRPWIKFLNLFLKCMKCADRHESMECPIYPERKQNQQSEGQRVAKHIQCPVYLQYLVKLINKRYWTIQQQTLVRATKTQTQQQSTHETTTTERGTVSTTKNQYTPHTITSTTNTSDNAEWRVQTNITAIKALWPDLNTILFTTILFGKSNELQVFSNNHNPDILFITEIKTIINRRPPALGGFSIAYLRLHAGVAWRSISTLNYIP